MCALLFKDTLGLPELGSERQPDGKLTCKEFPVGCGSLYSHLRGSCWQLVLQIIVPEWLCFAKFLEMGVEGSSREYEGV